MFSEHPITTRLGETSRYHLKLTSFVFCDWLHTSTCIISLQRFFFHWSSLARNWNIEFVLHEYRRTKTFRPSPTTSLYLSVSLSLSLSLMHTHKHTNSICIPSSKHVCVFLTHRESRAYTSLWPTRKGFKKNSGILLLRRMIRSRSVQVLSASSHTFIYTRTRAHAHR